MLKKREKSVIRVDWRCKHVNTSDQSRVFPSICFSLSYGFTVMDESRVWEFVNNIFDSVAKLLDNYLANILYQTLTSSSFIVKLLKQMFFYIHKLALNLKVWLTWQTIS